MAKKVKGLSFYTKKKTLSKSLLHEIFSWVFLMFVSVITALIFTFAAGMSIRMLGISMAPTLLNGQEVLVNRVIYNMASPKRGDVIVFKLHAVQESNYYIKRVIGVPGDTVQIIDGRVFINGEMYHESSAFDKIADPGTAEEPITLKDNEFFVLGDNRNNSEDSRNADIGLITEDMITGRAWFALANGVNGMNFVK